MKQPEFLSRPLFKLRQYGRRIWVRTSAFALLAVLSALGSRVIGPYVPDSLVKLVNVDAVIGILNTVSTSMLAVTTFSLGVLMSARHSITSNITPRAHKTAVEDSVTQSVLATFLGAFVYALTSLVLIRSGLYQDESAAVILLVSIFVIISVVVAMLRWIEHLASLGSIPDTVAEIEDDFQSAFNTWRHHPAFGANPLADGAPLPDDVTHSVQAEQSGYVQHIDLAALDEEAERVGNAQIFIMVGAGSLVVQLDELCRYSGTADPKKIRKAFSIGRTRSFDQDPRFGILVLSEIAQRALSPAVNDPGTAIYILGRMVSILAADGPLPDAEEPKFPRIHMKAITADDLLRDGFGPIARDGDKMVEIQIRIQKSLAALARAGGETMAAAARKEAIRAAAFAEKGLILEEDKADIRDLVKRLEQG